MFIEQYKTIFDDADFYDNKFGLTRSEEPISNDQYNVSNKIAHVVSASGKQGFFGVRFDALSVGDVIEFECEFRSISGVLPKVGIDEMSGNINASKMVFSSKKQGEWEVLNGKYIVENSTYHGDHRLSFGLFTADSGEFYVRNIKVKCHCNNVENVSSITSGEEFGSKYVKYPDGTLISYTTTTIEGIANTNVTKNVLYAMSFVSHPVRFANIEHVSVNDNFTLKNLSYRRGSLASGQLVINTDVSQTYTINLIAIGRWK